MQEEVEQKVVTLIIDCSKLTEAELRKALAKLSEHMKASHQKHQYNKQNPHGKMTVKQLAAQNKGMQSIEVTDKNIGSFTRVARKYGIDFAPFKVKGQDRYMIFFKSQDLNAMTAAFKDYSDRKLQKAERPTILERLAYFKTLIKAPVLDKNRNKEHVR